MSCNFQQPLTTLRELLSLCTTFSPIMPGYKTKAAKTPKCSALRNPQETTVHKYKHVFVFQFSTLSLLSRGKFHLQQASKHTRQHQIPKHIQVKNKKTKALKPPSHRLKQIRHGIECNESDKVLCSEYSR